jgi:hypothetical protein
LSRESWIKFYPTNQTDVTAMLDTVAEVDFSKKWLTEVYTRFSIHIWLKEGEAVTYYITYQKRVYTKK